MSAGRAHGARGSCGAGVLGPPCSLSWRLPPAMVPHPPLGAPLGPGLPPAHSLATWPCEVCCLSLCCGGFPGQQISAKAWTKQSVMEQTRERPGTGQEQGAGTLTCVPQPLPGLGPASEKHRWSLPYDDVAGKPRDIVSTQLQSRLG